MWLHARLLLVALLTPGLLAFLVLSTGGKNQLQHKTRNPCRPQSSPRMAASSPYGDTQVLIVGSGIAGLTLAADLERRGIDYLVVEKASAPREGGTAIGMFTQAWRVLDNLDIGDSLRETVSSASTFRIGTSSGRQLVRFGLDECEGGPHEFRYIMRSDLLNCLLKTVPKKRQLYSAKVVTVQDKFEEGGPCTVELEGGQRITSQVVIGGDGVGSTIFKQLFPGESSANYAGYKAIRAVANFPSPLGANAFWTQEEGIVNQIWGQGVRMGSFKMSPTKVYWFITYNAPRGLSPDEVSQEALLDKARQLTAGWADERLGISALLSNTRPEDVLLTEIGDRWPRLQGWGKGCVTLVGDAAHPMTPNLGQGGAAAMEDALELGETLSKDLDRGALRLSQSLRDFERRRLPRCAKLTIKSNVFGTVLQLPWTPVTAVRDTALPIIFMPKHFLEHTEWCPPPRPA